MSFKCVRKVVTLTVLDFWIYLFIMLLYHKCSLTACLFQPHQDHPDRGGAVCPAADPLPASPEAPPDAHLHRLYRRQQGQSGVPCLTRWPWKYVLNGVVMQMQDRTACFGPFNCLPIIKEAIQYHSFVYKFDLKSGKTNVLAAAPPPPNPWCHVF